MQITDPVESEIEKIEGKWISLKYPTKCSICGRPLKHGEIAYYEIYHYKDKTRRTRILCEACYYTERENDKQLVKLYLKKRELRKIIRQLEKQAEEYAQKLEELEPAMRIRNLQVEARRIIQALDSSIEDRGKLYEISRKLDNLLRELEEVSEFLNSVIVPKYVKRKVVRYGYRRY